LVHGDTPQAKLDKLDALLRETATSRQDVSLFAEMLSVPNDGRYPALHLAPQQRRQKTLEALGLQLEALTRSNPVLMIFEDLQWSDPTSLEALLGRHCAVALGEAPLQRYGAANRVHDAGKFNQQPVAHRLDDTALVLCNAGGDQLVAQAAQPRNRALLIRPGQPAVARHVGGKDSNEPTFDATLAHKPHSLQSKDYTTAPLRHKQTLKRRGASIAFDLLK
jgi:hypothetical protein